MPSVGLPQDFWMSVTIMDHRHMLSGTRSASQRTCPCMPPLNYTSMLLVKEAAPDWRRSSWRPYTNWMKHLGDDHGLHAGQLYNLDLEGLELLVRHPCSESGKWWWWWWYTLGEVDKALKAAATSAVIVAGRSMASWKHASHIQQ